MDTVLDQLNTYTGDNIWQDVILNLDGYDEAATERIDRDSTRFVAAGVTYVRDAQTDQWLGLGSSDAHEHFADAAWDSDTITVFAGDEGGGEQVAGGGLEWVDPDDDSTEADDRRRQAIVEALANLGWEPMPGEEWVHVEGGLGSEAGAERVPVQPIASR